MRISVVIPTYNRAELLRGALASVLSQSYRPVEVIVVDDGSTDATSAVLEGVTPAFGVIDVQLKVVRQNRGGPSAARNVAVKQTSGDAIAFLDSDDRWAPEYLATAARLLTEYPTAGLAFCGVVARRPDGSTVGVRDDGLSGEPEEGLLETPLPRIVRHMPLQTSGVVVRTNAFNVVGGFDTALRVGEDWNTWYQIAVKFNFAFCRRPLVEYLEHPGNMPKHDVVALHDALVVDLRLLERGTGAFPREVVTARVQGTLRALARRALRERRRDPEVRQLLTSQWAPTDLPFRADLAMTRLPTVAGHAYWLLTALKRKASRVFTSAPTQTVRRSATGEAIPVPQRYRLIDALRGIAALAVVSHHLLHATVMDATLHRILPDWFLAVCDFGSHGVEVFFVISGFVIAHSIRGLRPNWAGSVNFILRRQLRLDLPYWVMLVICLIDSTVENHIPSLIHKSFPGVGVVLANLLYLQGVTGQPQVLGVSWTLCLEIQFYLLFLAAAALGYRLSRVRANPSSQTTWIVVISGMVCLAFVKQQWELVAWFPSFWHYFVFGAVCYWATHRLMASWVFAMYATAFAAMTAWANSSYMLIGLITAIALFAAGKTGRLATLGSNVALQYSGRISYSLYLVHLTVLSLILRGGYKLTHENRWAALGWFFLAAGSCVLIADLFHRAVEMPSIRWSARLKPRPVAVAEAADVAADALPVRVPA